MPRLISWISSETFAVLRGGRVFLEHCETSNGEDRKRSDVLDSPRCLTTAERFPFGVEGFSVSPNRKLIAFHSGTHITVDRLPSATDDFATASSSSSSSSSGAVMNLHSSVVEMIWHPLSNGCCLCLSATKLHVVSINERLHSTTTRISEPSLRLHCDRIPLPVTCSFMSLGCHTPRSELCKTKHLCAESQSTIAADTSKSTRVSGSSAKSSSLLSSSSKGSLKVINDDSSLHAAFAQFSVYCLSEEGEIIVINPIVPHGFAVSSSEFRAMRLIIENCIENCMEKLNDRSLKLRSRVDTEQSLLQAELSLKWLDSCWQQAGSMKEMNNDSIVTWDADTDLSRVSHTMDVSSSSPVWVYDHSVVLTTGGDSSSVIDDQSAVASPLTAADHPSSSATIVRPSAHVILRNISSSEDDLELGPGFSACLSVACIDLKQVSQLNFGSQSSTSLSSDTIDNVMVDQSSKKIESDLRVNCESPFLVRVFADGTLDVIWVKELPMPIWNVGHSSEEMGRHQHSLLDTSSSFSRLSSFYGSSGVSGSQTGGFGMSSPMKRLPCVVLHRVTGIADSLRELIPKDDVSNEPRICPTILQCNESLLIGSSLLEMSRLKEWRMSVTIIHLYWLHFIQSAMHKGMFERLLQNETICGVGVRVVEEMNVRCAAISGGHQKPPKFDDWSQDVWNDVYFCDCSLSSDQGKLPLRSSSSSNTLAKVVWPIPELMLFPNVVTTSSIVEMASSKEEGKGRSESSSEPYESLIQDLSEAQKQFEKSKDDSCSSMMLLSSDNNNNNDTVGSLKIKYLDECLPDLKGLQKKMELKLDDYKQRAQSGKVDLTSAEELNVFLSQVRDETLSVMNALKQSYQLYFDRQDWCMQVSSEVLPNLCEKLSKQCTMLSENNAKMQSNQKDLYESNVKLRNMLDDLLKKRQLSLDYSMDDDNNGGGCPGGRFPVRSKIPSFAEEKLMSWMKNLNEEYAVMSAEVRSMDGRLNVTELRKVMHQMRENQQRKQKGKENEDEGSGKMIDADVTDSLFFDDSHIRSQVQSALSEIQSQITSMKRTAQLVSDKVESVEGQLNLDQTIDLTLSN